MPSVTGNRTVRAGFALFAVGLVFIAIDVIPFFLHDHNRPLWLNLACLAAPAGFAIAIGSALRNGRAEAREAARSIADGSAHGTLDCPNKH